MREITLEELLEAGCHFGHQVTRQNPKARDFVFEARDNIHIIDLAKTKEGLEAAAAFVKAQARQGGTMIVVGTKRQARTIVEEEVKRAREAGPTGAPTIFSVTNRWIGGILTNFSEVAKNYKRLNDITGWLQSDEEKAKYTKKEVGLWEKERQKLENFYGGIKDIKQIPKALFIIDTHLENLAVREAKSVGVASVGIVDTNADPGVIDAPIPANDDAVGSLQLIISYIIDAWIEGQHERSEGARLLDKGETQSRSKAEVSTSAKEAEKPVVDEEIEKKESLEVVPKTKKKATKVKEEQPKVKKPRKTSKKVV